ncbi:MAG: NADP transhydrogenase subunit alpha [Promethearchaeota archaeon]|nr:MAG: NADP transhydrogenase subunit alpha [Candidatus Lokiarchaeota archaeon]
MRFCVIGAGSGGRAFAAYIASKGYSVSLYNRSFTRICAINEKSGIDASGELTGFFPLDCITQDIKLAVKDANVIMVVTPASAHKHIAKMIAPYLTEGQIIILNPGRTFGSIEFIKIVEKYRGNIPIFVGETQTLLFTSRQLSENKVNIIKIKDSVGFSCFPDKYNDLVYEIIKDIFPQLEPIDDYFEITLNNIGMLLHPTISLFNAGLMDFGKKFKFYKEGTTPRVCLVLEMIEMELNEIFEKLGLKQLRYHKWAEKSYGVKAETIYEAIQKVDPYQDIYAPPQLITRYFTEDVPTGLVPISSLGKFLGVPTPTIDSVIHLASILCGIDFMKEGRIIEKLQIQNLLTERLYVEDIAIGKLFIEERDKSSKTKGI